MSGQDGKGTNFPHGVAAGGQVIALSVLIGQALITPISLATGIGAISTITVPGVVLGKYAIEVIAPGDLQGVSVSAYVSAKDTVAIRFQNGTAGTLTPPAGVYTVQCMRVVA